LSGLSDVTTAVDVMKKGAFDFIMKPVKKAELLGAIERALSHKDLLERNKQLEKENREYQLYLEDKVRERTKELSAKTEELKEAYGLLKVTNIQVVKVLAETIEAKDPCTKGHCDRMRTLSTRIAATLDMTDEEREILDYATILHDLGKVGVHETVLNKNMKLSDHEFEHVKRHSLIGERILEGISLMGQAAKVVGAHHEKYDGTGYPRGLKENAIPLASRIIAVVDTFDAMRSDRPYRNALPLTNILDEMQRVAGSQLDPSIVKLFLDEKLYL
ncbi:MAG: HD domain-containing protein, partial [Deltaproteobacteria bacterium]|nr:HD domain-containing protein [Deltaproteobacteria bacterium]